MSPITHFLVSWLVADQIVERDRDKAAIACAGVLADSDGLGVLADIVNDWMGRPETFYYVKGHHWLAHGLFGCLLISIVMAALAVAKKRVFGGSLLTTHLHLLCDLVGSRGPDPGDIWTIFYLGPFSRQGEWIWRGQWRLDGWQNVTFTLLLIGLIGRTAWRWGRSPLSLLSVRAHRVFVDTLRQRFGDPPCQ